MDQTLQERLKALSVKSCGTNDLSLLNNPNLEAERASREFIMMLKDLSSLMNDVTMVDRADCKGEIPRFDSCGISAVGACTTKCVPGSKLEDSYITYDMVKYKVGHTVDEDMLDCNKLGRRLNDVAMQALMIKMKNNMELAAIMGDEDLATGEGQSDYNNLMGVNDGWLKLALNSVPTAQILDAEGAGPSFGLFLAARKLLPPRYRTNRNAYRFIGGPSLSDWWLEDTAGRPTVAGDNARETGQAARLLGNSFYEVPQWPEDLPHPDHVDGVTHILYTPLANLMLFMRRQIEIETERRIECDDYLSIGWFTQDFAIAEPEAIVLIKNVGICAAAWTGCERAGMDKCAPEPHDLELADRD